MAKTRLVEQRDGGRPLPVDLSVEVFVDDLLDLLKLTLVPDGRALFAKARLDASNAALDEAIAPGGYAQNIGKQESLARLPKKEKAEKHTKKVLSPDAPCKSCFILALA